MSKRNAKPSFHQELVLNQWMMGFFKGGTLQAMKNRLGIGFSTTNLCGQKIRLIEEEFMKRMREAEG